MSKRSPDSTVQPTNQHSLQRVEAPWKEHGWKTIGHIRIHPADSMIHGGSLSHWPYKFMKLNIKEAVITKKKKYTFLHEITNLLVVFSQELWDRIDNRNIIYFDGAHFLHPLVESVQIPLPIPSALCAVSWPTLRLLMVMVTISMVPVLARLKSETS